jgi:hypothetical protein
MSEDFSKIVKQIAQTGISDSEIGRTITEAGVPVSQPTISRIRSGLIKRPSYDLGVALKTLYKKRVPAAMRADSRS